MKCKLAILGERYGETLRGRVPQMYLSPYMVIPQRTTKKPPLSSKSCFNAKANDSIGDIPRLSS